MLFKQFDNKYKNPVEDIPMTNSNLLISSNKCILIELNLESNGGFFQNISYEDGILKSWCPGPFLKSPYFVTPNQSLIYINTAHK